MSQAGLAVYSFEAPVFLSFDRIELMVQALLNAARRWSPEIVVGIARGGIVPSSMAASALGLDLRLISHVRATGETAWITTPAEDRRILLVDDGCGTGTVMKAVHDFLASAGYDCLTLAVVHDPNRVIWQPDLSHPMESVWRFPWERGESTPSARQHMARTGFSVRHCEQAFFAISCGALSTASSAGASNTRVRRVYQDPEDGLHVLRSIPKGQFMLVSDTVPANIGQLRQALLRAGYGDVPIESKPPARVADATALAQYKARTATNAGCTHFIESDASHALLIAQFAPHLIVMWWSAERRQIYTLSAACGPRVPRSGGRAAIDRSTPWAAIGRAQVPQHRDAQLPAQGALG